MLFSCGNEKRNEENNLSSENSGNFKENEDSDSIISFTSEESFCISEESVENSDSCSSKTDDSDNSKPETENLMKVHFIDVGQGDSAFIEFPDKTYMLIDSGLPKYSHDVIRFIQSRGCKKIDYLVMTHPHADHIGGMKDIIDFIDIGCIYMPNASSNSELFLNILKSINEHEIPVIEAKAGTVIKNSNNLCVSVIAPVVPDTENLNNCSAVIRAEYGKRSFLFMGDAEKEEEMSIKNLKECDVLKVGHHGSNSSSSYTFLSKVRPHISVISCGKNNEYGHPHKETLERLLKFGTSVFYRTDLNGTISLFCDGEDIYREKNLKQEDVSFKFTLNTKSKKIHTFGSSDTQTIKEENRIYSDKTLAELKKLGYSCCQGCDPKD